MQCNAIQCTLRIVESHPKAIHFTFSKRLPMSHRLLLELKRSRLQNCLECIKIKFIRVGLVTRRVPNKKRYIRRRCILCAGKSSTMARTATQTESERERERQGCREKMLTGEWYTVQWLNICQRAQQALFGIFMKYESEKKIVIRETICSVSLRHCWWCYCCCFGTNGNLFPQTYSDSPNDMHVQKKRERERAQCMKYISKMCCDNSKLW